jgi:ABC-type transporter Mla MlaB component
MKITLLTGEDPVWTARIEGRVEFAALLGADPLPRDLGADCFRHRVVLDLSAVEWLDSAGIGWLMQHAQRFSAAGGKLVLHSATPAVRNLLVGLMKLAEQLPLATDLETALRVALA